MHVVQTVCGVTNMTASRKYTALIQQIGSDGEREKSNWFSDILLTSLRCASFSRPLIRRASVTSFSHPPQHANQHANQIFRHSHGEHSTRTSSIKTRLRACVRPYCLVLIIFQCAQSGTHRRPAAGIPNWATCPHARQATGVLIKLSVSIGAHVHAAHAQGE